MQTRTFTVAACSVLSLIGLASIPGCASEKETAREAMIEQAGTFRQQLNKMPAQLEDVSKRLLAATSGQNASRADDFREYSKSLAALRGQAQQVGREANIAEVDAAKYFTAWSKEARRAQSADRSATRDAAAASREQVSQALGYLQKARTDFSDLIVALDKIEKQLGASLSEASVMAVQPSVQVANSKLLDVRNRIDRLDNAIDAAVASK